MGFRAWLRRQSDRDDPVGDVARDVDWDMRRRRKTGARDYFPAHPAALDEVLGYLARTSSASEGALQAFRLAWAEYEALADGRP